MRQITMRCSDSFKDMNILDFYAERQILKRLEDEEFYYVHTPTEVTEKIIEDQLKEIGQIVKWDHFLDQDSFLDVIRGSIKKKNDSKEYFFYITSAENGKFYYSSLKHMISGLIHSGKELDD